MHRHIEAIAAAAVAMVLLVGCPQNADAASRELRRQAKQMANTAAKLFADKQFIEAAQLFEQAFALDSAKVVRLRNAGRAYEEAGSNINALRCFEQFAKITRSKKLKRDALERIARLRAKTSSEAASMIVEEAAKPAPKRAKKKLSSAATADKTVRAKTPPATRPNWLLVGAGASLVATGAGLLVYASGVGSDIDDHVGAGHYEYSGGAQKLADDRGTVSTNKSASYAVMGAGALLAGAAVLVLRTKVGKTTAWAPMLAPGSVGLLMTARF